MTLPFDTNRSQDAIRTNSRWSLQPTPAWAAILGLVIFTILGILAGAGFFRIGFLALSFSVGIFLYQRYPVLYTGFTWWLYFLTPLLRRLIDYRAGFQTEAIILAAPFLVTAITLPGFIRYILKSYPYRQTNLPFVLAFVAICYSFLIGLVNLEFSFRLIRTFAEWVSPVAFGFFVSSKWQNYPTYRKNTQRIFLWGTLVMGAYGLVQFIAMPPWDSYWQQKVVEEVGYVNAIGGESGTAIWGTTNTNGTLALLLMPGILLLLTRQSSLSILAAVIGCLASLLTNSRTAWILVLIALFIVIGNLRSQLQIKIILFALVVGLLVLPLANIQPFSGMISSRLGTLSNVLHDSSFQGRSAQYTEFLEDGLLNPIGRGLSSVNHPDSGIINVIAEMGWLGATPFLGALILLVWQMFQASRENDLFMFVARAIAVPLIISPSGNFFSALPAFMIWFFAGMVMASHRYYQHQLNQP